MVWTPQEIEKIMEAINQNLKSEDKNVIRQRQRGKKRNKSTEEFKIA